METRRIWTALVAVMLIGLAGGGCKSMSPAESTQSALGGTRDLIRETVAEKPRAEKMLVIVDQLDRDLDAYVAQRAKIDQALVEKNADYAVSREDMQPLYDQRNREYRGIAMKIAQAHMSLSELATPEEWKRLGKPKHRIQGL
jgi:hypothetical protein